MKFLDYKIPLYSKIGPLREGLVCVQNLEGKYGFLNKLGEVVIPFIYKNAYCFQEGLAGVQNEEGFWGFVDRNGKTIIPFQYFAVRSFNEGLCCVKNAEDLWGYIDKNGKLVIQHQYVYALSFSEGLAGIYPFNNMFNGRMGYIDKDGTVIIPFEYTSGYSFKNGVAGVCDHFDGKKVINKNNEQINDLSIVEYYWEHLYDDEKYEIPSIPIPVKYRSELIFDGKSIEIEASTEDELIAKKKEALANAQKDILEAFAILNRELENCEGIKREKTKQL